MLTGGTYGSLDNWGTADPTEQSWNTTDQIAENWGTGEDWDECDMINNPYGEGSLWIFIGRDVWNSCPH